MKIYVYTEKGESRARALNLDERKAGTMAYFAHRPLHECTRDMQKAWEQHGYVEAREV